MAIGADRRAAMPAGVEERAHDAVVAAHGQQRYAAQGLGEVAARFGQFEAEREADGQAAEHGLDLMRVALFVGVVRDRHAHDVCGLVRGSGLEVGEGAGRECH